MKLLLLVLLAASVCVAQETRSARKGAATAEDARPNDDRVPDAYAITGHFDRIVVARLKYQTDVLAGLKKIVQQEKIRNGVILSGVGSVRGYQLHTVSNRTFPSEDTFVKNPTQPADLVSMNGYVIDGRLHPHMTLATPDKVMAGHLEPGTEVFTFVIVTIGVMNDANFRHLDDEHYR